MPFNLSNIGEILGLTTFFVGFLWIFSNDMPFTPVAVLAFLTVAAFVCNEA